MAANCRFAFAVHILTCLAHREGGSDNSASLAGSVNTNAVVIRRILSDLRRAGLVRTHRGAAGGARLSRPPEEIHLDSVYRAIDCGPSFALAPHRPDPRCPVGVKIEQALEEIFSVAERALEEALAERSLADVLQAVTGNTPKASAATAR